MKFKRLSGFTLIELLIVLSVVAFMGACLTPDLKNLVDIYQHRNMVQRINNEILLAKSLAVSKQEEIVYCASNNDEWQGTRVIKDQRSTNYMTFQPLPYGYRLQLRNSLHWNDCLKFTPLGFTKEQRASFYLNGPIMTSRIIISLSGQIHIQESASN